ncbi:MAG: radical SAM protein [Candidatus Hadarchaeales archaeon]
MPEIVLTADRNLMSDYGGSIFTGFAACAPRLLPDPLFHLFLCPPLPHRKGVALFAPAGTRKIEAVLLEEGFDVVVGHPDHLEEVVDEKTRAVGITTNDPLGLGPASSTFSSLVGRETYSAIHFRELITPRVLRRANLRVIVGGPGAWQLAESRLMAKYGIDCVVLGEGEVVAPELFRRAVRGESLPPLVEGGPTPLEKIPSIRNPTVSGIVEVARGCGRGCRFCVPTQRYLRSLPLEKIKEEMRVNAAAGHLVIHAEDVLRYGASGILPDEQKVVALFQEVARTGMDASASHAAFASVASSPSLVQRITELLNIGSKQKPFFGVQMGIETGSPSLIERHMKGKALPFRPEEWPEVVVRAHGILADQHWVPCSTLVMGLPGETQRMWKGPGSWWRGWRSSGP